ncbi:MAG: hypothetical protein M3O36_10455 [Myxococcota bacterium]|nr:hypothetical protein [Myxococcota bacterium]
MLERVHIGSDSSLPDFQRADDDVSLMGAPFSRVNLIVDLESPCFPFTKWKMDPPLPGQSWPADCDAFDRNFEMSVVDTAAPPGTPSIELVRAITPFGGPLHVEQDVTDAFNAAPTMQTFHVTLGAYLDPAGRISGSKGGWFVSAHLDVTPGAPPSNVLAVIPLYFADVIAGQTVADLPFTLPAGTTSTRSSTASPATGALPGRPPIASAPPRSFAAASTTYTSTAKRSGARWRGARIAPRSACLRMAAPSARGLIAQRTPADRSRACGLRAPIGVLVASPLRFRGHPGRSPGQGPTLFASPSTASTREAFGAPRQSCTRTDGDAQAE